MEDIANNKQIRLVINSVYFEFISDVNLGFNNYFLQKNKSIDDIDADFRDTSIWSYLGLTFKETLIDSVYFVKTEPFTSLIDLQKSTYNGVLDIEIVFNFLWFIKDNSCNALALGIYCPNEYAAIRNATHLFSNAAGEFQTTQFTIDEINRAVSIMEKYVAISSDIDVVLNDDRLIHNGIAKGTGYDINYNEYNRVERAMNFLKQARRTPLLPEKISFYVLMLECLFSSSDGTEIQYKIRERVARYIGNDFAERKAIFDNVKSYYDIRSKYVHGQQLDSKYVKAGVLLRKSQEIDELARRIFTKVIMEDIEHFTQNDDALKEWFVKDILREN